MEDGLHSLPHILIGRRLHECVKEGAHSTNDDCILAFKGFEKGFKDGWLMALDFVVLERAKHNIESLITHPANVCGNFEDGGYDFNVRRVVSQNDDSDQIGGVDQLLPHLFVRH